MKKPTIYEKQYKRPVQFHNSYHHPIGINRTNSTSADFSLDKQFRRISPAPQERFSHVPNQQLIYSLQTYPTNDYLMSSRQHESYAPASNPDYAKTIQDLLQRVEKLEGKSSKWEKMEERVQRLEGSTVKMGAQLEGMQARREQSLRGKENILNNMVSKREEEMKLKIKEYVTKEELQRQLTGLETTVKSLLASFKKSISEEVGNYNRKNKEKFTDITSRQLTEKLELFKTNFIKEWTLKVEHIVKDTWQTQLVGKNVMGVSRQKFIGNAVPLKIREELAVQVSGTYQEMVALEVKYFLDSQGYLLDSELHYLLDKNGQQIQLQQSLIVKLSKEGILEQVQENKTSQSSQ